MELTIGFGTAPQTIRIPDRNVMDVLTPNSVEITSFGQAEVVRALGEPIGTAPLAELAAGKKKVAIVTSDITRPMPTWVALPPVLEELARAGVKPEEVTVVLALGSHRVHTEEEKAKSYSNETTTAEDITLQNYAEALPPILRHLSEKVASRMKRDGVRAYTIGVMVKTGAFQRHSRQTTLSFSTDDPAEIFRTADQLMHRLLFAGEGNTEPGDEQEEAEDGLFSRGEVLRLVGVSAAKLTNKKEVYRQLSLFDLPPEETEQEKAQKEAQKEAQKREAALKDMMDRINRRFGDKAVKKGAL